MVEGLPSAAAVRESTPWERCEAAMVDAASAQTAQGCAEALARLLREIHDSYRAAAETSYFASEAEGLRAIAAELGPVYAELTRIADDHAPRCQGCGERWPCSDSVRRDISGVERAKHMRARS